MSTNERLVQRDAAGSFATAGGFGRCRVTLVYDPGDPFAVTLDIPVGGGRVVSWEFSRELLNDGRLGDLQLPTGDVAIRPDLGDTVRVELRSPDGHALFWLRADDVAAFLAATYDAVLAGTEAARIDWDRELRLVGAGGAR